MVFTFSFFFNYASTTGIYTLSLHDALPIFEDALDVLVAHHSHDTDQGREVEVLLDGGDGRLDAVRIVCRIEQDRDRKSTRLNSSHPSISYAVFCLKKKKKTAKLLAPSYPAT